MIAQCISMCTMTSVTVRPIWLHAAQLASATILKSSRPAHSMDVVKQKLFSELIDKFGEIEANYNGGPKLGKSCMISILVTDNNTLMYSRENLTESLALFTGLMYVFGLSEHQFLHINTNHVFTRHTHTHIHTYTHARARAHTHTHTHTHTIYMVLDQRLREVLARSLRVAARAPARHQITGLQDGPV